MTDAEFLQWLKSPTSIRTVLVEVGAYDGTTEKTVYLSNRTYITSDNLAYDACITGGIAFKEDLSLDGTASSGVGDIELENASGSRDDWLDYVWANRPLTVWMGDVRWERSEFRKVFDGVTHDIDAPSLNTLSISVLNKLDRINNPALEEKLGGTTDNKDQVIPAVIGEVFNVEPLLVDPTNLVYQVHKGLIQDIIEVRDNGGPRTITKNLPDGKFQITLSNVVGQITASVQGHATDGYSNTIPGCIQKLVTNYGTVDTRFTDADIDLVNFAAFAIACPQPVGICIDEGSNVLNSAQELAKSVGAQIVCSSLGKLRIVRVNLPAPATTFTVTAEDMEFQSISIKERVEVKAASRIDYCKNYTVQSSGLATGLPASSADNFGKEYWTVNAADTGIGTLYKLTAEPESEQTLLLVEADAQAEADRRLELWSVQRTVFEFKCFAHLMLTELGESIIVKHRRYGLTSGKTGQIISITRDWLKGRVTLGVLI